MPKTDTERLDAMISKGFVIQKIYKNDELKNYLVVYYHPKLDRQLWTEKYSNARDAIDAAIDQQVAKVFQKTLEGSNKNEVV